MNQFNIHKDVLDNLNHYIDINSIPNIIFNGPSGSGKRRIVHKFINTIFNNDSEAINKYVICENCALGKGINFIRTTLKDFSKITNFNNNIKIIVLYNADKLTIDAQSAMRRLIEVFSKTTRFFILIENLKLLLQPMISRFCHIHISFPIIDNKITNLYDVNNLYNRNDNKYLLNQFNRLPKKINIDRIKQFSKNIYSKGYSCNDLNKLICSTNIQERHTINYIYNIIKKEIRNEIVLIQLLLILYYFRSNDKLENIILI